MQLAWLLVCQAIRLSAGINKDRESKADSSIVVKRLRGTRLIEIAGAERRVNVTPLVGPVALLRVRSFPTHLKCE